MDRSGEHDEIRVGPPEGDPTSPWFATSPLHKPDEPVGPSGDHPLPTRQPTTSRREPRSRRGWWTALALLMAALLLTAGALLGVLIAPDRSPDTPAQQVSPPTSTGPPAGSGPSPGAGGPTGSGSAPADGGPGGAGPVDGRDEPVAAVAAVVAPSVVLVETRLGQGSGIIWDSDGRIVTNAHVVGSSNATVVVQLADGTRLEGEVLGADPRYDVALIAVDPLVAGDALVPAVFASDDSVRVGQLAVAIGSPFGLQQTVTAGIVSAVNRAVPNELAGADGNLVEMIQTDAPINRGNSGGALADRDGRVIGMNTAIRTDGSTAGNVGVGFAIPSGTVTLIAQRILDGEPLVYGYLGIRGENPAVGRPGAVVVEVVPGDPAAAAGLEPGDLVVAMDGVAVTSMSDLAARVRLAQPGTEVVLDVVRDDAEISLTVTLGSV